MLRRGRRDIMYYSFPLRPDARELRSTRLRRQCQKCDSIDTLPSHYAQSTWPNVGRHKSMRQPAVSMHQTIEYQFFRGTNPCCLSSEPRINNRVFSDRRSEQLYRRHPVLKGCVPWRGPGSLKTTQKLGATNAGW
jgi:hypothetical protein